MACPQPAHRPRRPRGFTLVEVMAAVAVVGILAAVALPSQLGQLQRSRRIDAHAALMRVQAAQEQYRSSTGAYAAQLSALTGTSTPRSPDGLYELALNDVGTDSVTLVARALPDRAQHSDTACLEITMRLNQGLADLGPNGRCWNR
jgi:type IV pilus assembly protein PilE